MYVCMYVPLFLHNHDRYMTQPIYILDQHDEAEIIRGQPQKKKKKKKKKKQKVGGCGEGGWG